MLPICEVLETKTTYKCDQCEEEFKLKGLLTKHKKNNHNVKLKFECKQCEKCFSSDQVDTQINDLFLYNKLQHGWTERTQIFCCYSFDSRERLILMACWNYEMLPLKT